MLYAKNELRKQQLQEMNFKTKQVKKFHAQPKNRRYN